MYGIYRDESAMASLQQSWELADEGLRGAILRALQKMDHRLKEKPSKKGESRGGKTRILFEAPLVMTYLVDEESQLVRVLRTWVYVGKSDRANRAA